MTAIVVNLSTAAVSHYDWAHPALCPTHVGSDEGLFTMTGDTDAGDPIDAYFDTGITQREGAEKGGLEGVYFGITGEVGTVGMLRVSTRLETFKSEFVVRERGMARAKAGRGIRENYLGFGYENVDGCDFQINSMEILTTKSKTRRL